jgi:cellulose synthase/poly-beta-1,6-N-acetylglucosamine synthase-like glycosyltransferase
MNLADFAAWAVAAPPSVATFVVSLEILLGLAPARSPSAESAAPERTTILMPAHDEERVIGRTLARLKETLPSGMDVLVIADNCTDGTAALARSFGVEVVERSDPAQRGKGFALAFGRDHLQASPPNCALILDADCETDAESLQNLAAAAMSRDRPAQGAYLLRPTRGSPVVEVSTFAFAIKNLIRQLGLQHLGAPAVLTGTGMAFPWRIFADAPLATASIVEDLDLGLDLLTAGKAPTFLAEARIWSDPSGAAGTLTQRSRWESGFLATARRRALPLIGAALTRLSWQRLWMGLHLLTPPLVLLIFINAAACLLLAVAAALGVTHLPLLLLAGLQAVLALALLGAWARLGSAFLSPSAALRLPLYAAWKVPLYARMLVGKGPKVWVRTDRDQSS